jgi:hypothetical protein
MIALAAWATKKAGAVQTELASFNFGSYALFDLASREKLPRRQESRSCC